MSFSVIVAALLVVGLAGDVRAADGAADVNAVLDKAIRALGGAEKLGKIKAFSLAAKSTITVNGTANAITQRAVVRLPDHLRMEFSGEWDGMPIEGVTVVAGDKGWRSFAGNVAEMDRDALANEKRMAYLALIPMTILPLKDAGKFKVEAIADERVGDKPAAGLKVTPTADGKEFRLYFDKESGLPVRLVAKVVDYMGEEYTQDTTYGGYEEMAGTRRATKVQARRNGEKFVDQEVTEFKPLDQVDPKSFEEPK